MVPSAAKSTSFHALAAHPGRCQTAVRFRCHRRLLTVAALAVLVALATSVPGLWWSRNVVHWTKVKNYVAPPNHYANQKLQDVWLSED